MLKKLITTEQLSEMIGVAVPTLNQWRSQRRGPPYRKLGGLVRYDPEEVQRWLDQQRVECDAPVEPARSIVTPSPRRWAGKTLVPRLGGYKTKREKAAEAQAARVAADAKR